MPDHVKQYPLLHSASTDKTHYVPGYQKRGYTVMQLDFTDVANTPWGYNPLSYIREDHDPAASRNGDYCNEQDVKRVAQAICPCQFALQTFEQNGHG